MTKAKVTGENIMVKRIASDGEIDLEKMAAILEKLNAEGEYRGRRGEFAYNASRGGIVFNPYVEEKKSKPDPGQHGMDVVR